MAEITYGPRGLELMAAGASAADALARLLADDDGRDTRQVAMIDAAGNAVVHTGDRCISEAGHLVGDGWTVEANMMRRTGVPEAMAEALSKAADGPLADAARAIDPGWGDLLRRLPAAGLWPTDEDVIERLLT